MLHRASCIAGAWLLFATAAQAAVPVRDPHAEATSLYSSAFAAAAEGRDDEARPLLERIIKEFPGEAVASYSRELLRLIDGRHSGKLLPRSGDLSLAPGRLSPPVPVVAPALSGAQVRELLGKRLRDEKPTRGARALLMTIEGMNGVALGVVTSLAFYQAGIPGFVLLPLSGGLVGALLPLGLTWQSGITMGHALAISMGTILGTAYGMEIGFSLPLPGYQASPTPFVVYGTIAAGQVLGTFAGELVWELTHASAGDVFFASSVAFWGSMVALLATVAFDRGPPVGWSMFAAGNAGLVLGSVLASQFPMSAGRVLVMHVGGIVAGGACAAFFAFLEYARADTSVAGTNVGYLAAAGGYAAGIILAGVFTPSYDLVDLPPLQPTVLPTWNGKVSPGLAFRF